MYCPFVVIDELEDIKREDSIDNSAEAFREFSRYARVGREVKRMMALDWSNANNRMPIDDLAAFDKIPSNPVGKKYKKKSLWRFEI